MSSSPRVPALAAPRRDGSEYAAKFGRVAPAPPARQPGQVHGGHPDPRHVAQRPARRLGPLAAPLKAALGAAWKQRQAQRSERAP